MIKRVTEGVVEWAHVRKADPKIGVGVNVGPERIVNPKGLEKKFPTLKLTHGPKYSDSHVIKHMPTGKHFSVYAKHGEMRIRSAGHNDEDLALKLADHLEEGKQMPKSTKIGHLKHAPDMEIHVSPVSKRMGDKTVKGLNVHLVSTKYKEAGKVALARMMPHGESHANIAKRLEQSNGSRFKAAGGVEWTYDKQESKIPRTFKQTVGGAGSKSKKMNKKTNRVYKPGQSTPVTQVGMGKGKYDDEGKWNKNEGFEGLVADVVAEAVLKRTLSRLV